MTPACAGQFALFDSRDPEDHRVAASMCAACPILAACEQRLEIAVAETILPGYGPQGTWAGRQIGASVIKPERYALEEAAFTDDEARLAHAAWKRGERDDRSRLGERVYQRRAKARAAALKRQSRERLAAA